MSTETNFGVLNGVNRNDPVGAKDLDQDQSPLRRDQPGRLEPTADLAERFEAALQWAEQINYRPALSAASIAGLVALAALAFRFTSPSETVAVEDQIVFAPEVADPRGNDNSVQFSGTVADGTRTDQSGNATTAGSSATATTGTGEAVEGSAAEVVKLVVHVVGAVRNPGLVHLDSGARVSDAVQAAGGLEARADSELLNLASPVQDGMQVMVPSVGDEISAPLLRPSQHSESLPDAASAARDKININSASIQELDQLRGVGPSIAAAIAAWRQENGPFQSVDDLEDVPGIGPAKLEALREQVDV